MDTICPCLNSVPIYWELVLFVSKTTESQFHCDDILFRLVWSRLLLFSLINFTTFLESNDTRSLGSTRGSLSHQSQHEGLVSVASTRTSDSTLVGTLLDTPVWGRPYSLPTRDFTLYRWLKTPDSPPVPVALRCFIQGFGVRYRLHPWPTPFSVQNLTGTYF